MSIDAYRWAWKSNTGKGSDKLVLLALADRAGEEMHCWPSMTRLANDTELDMKTVREALLRLEDNGLISRERRPGRVAVYQLLNVVRREDETPADFATPVQSGGPAQTGSPPPPESVAHSSRKRQDTPAKTGHRTYQEPTKEPTSESPKVARKLQTKRNLPDWLPATQWDGYIDMRRRQGKPLTPRALELAIAALEQLRQAGHEAGAVLDQSTLQGWRGLFPLRGDATGLQAQTARGERAVSTQARRVATLAALTGGEANERRQADERVIDGDAQRV